MRNFLVTGAAGFIGYEVCMQLSHAGHNVIALDGLVEGLYGKTEKLSRFKSLERMDRIQTMELDLSKDDLSLLKNFAPIDIVINLAAMPGLRKSWEIFNQYVDSNIIATEKLARFFLIRGYLALSMFQRVLSTANTQTVMRIRVLFQFHRTG